jgi:serine/threonine protein kinase
MKLIVIPKNTLVYKNEGSNFSLFPGIHKYQTNKCLTVLDDHNGAQFADGCYNPHTLDLCIPEHSVEETTTEQALSIHCWNVRLTTDGLQLLSKCQPLKQFTAHMTSIGSIENGYRYIKELGKGAFGNVWLAENVETKELVAIKEIKKALSGKATAKINHELTVLRYLVEKKLCEQWSACLKDVFTVDEAGKKTLRIVMEYVEGHTMAYEIEAVKQDLRLQNREIVKDLVLGLNALHEAGISHQDIKLQNIMYDKRRGSYIYLDLGLACLKENFVNQHTCTTSFIGTPYTFPPEVCKQDAIIKTFGVIKAHDIWALGIMLLLYFKSFDSEDLEDSITDIAKLCGFVLTRRGVEFKTSAWANPATTKDILAGLTDIPRFGSSPTWGPLIGLFLEPNPRKRLANWNSIVELAKSL